MFVMGVFHLRSLEIVTPRYFTDSEVGMVTSQISIDKDGFTRFLEIIASPEDSKRRRGPRLSGA